MRRILRFGMALTAVHAALPGRAAAPAPVKPAFDLVVRTSWYGPGFHGRLAADGSTYDERGMTAAHRHWRLGSLVLVRSPRTGRSAVLRITDRGPYIAGRGLDVSRAAARELGFEGLGLEELQVWFID